MSIIEEKANKENIPMKQKSDKRGSALRDKNQMKAFNQVNNVDAGNDDIIDEIVEDFPK